jgi:hypothetical protein
MFILSHPPRPLDPRGHSFDRAAKRSNNLPVRAHDDTIAPPPAHPFLLPNNANQQFPLTADKSAIAASSGRCQVLAGTGSPQPRKGRANG